jgi:hypothetical protein
MSISIMPQPPEQLFLDIPPASILDGTSGASTSEPWATRYCEAVSERRFGDAIFARYNIDGRSENGIFHGTDHTVEQEILLDAAGYYKGYPEIYAEALSFYLANSDKDTRPEIVEALRQVPAADPLRVWKNWLSAPFLRLREWCELNGYIG